MTFSSCMQKQALIIKLFKPLVSNEEKYEKIIELGRKLPPLSDEYKTPENLVKGCQSRLFLRCYEKDGKVRFQAQSDALISAGIAALLLAVYDDESPEAILKCPPDFLDDIGIFSSLSPNRSNGMRSLFLKMQQEALDRITHEIQT